MSQITLNQLLQTADGNMTERVLWLHPEGGGCYVIDVEDDGAIPIFRPLRDIEEQLAQGLLRVSPDDRWLAPLSDTAVSPKQRAKRDALWTMIAPLVLDQPAIFQRDARGEAIARLVSERAATKQTRIGCCADIGSGEWCRMRCFLISTDAVDREKIAMPKEAKEDARREPASKILTSPLRCVLCSDPPLQNTLRITVKLICGAPTPQ